jgi:hypothetical protein
LWTNYRYKTAGTCGDKSITITDRRFFDELRGLGLKNNQHLCATQSGAKASVNYMNVLASKHSINQHGKGRMCKILARHLLDTKQHDLIEKISKQRGTALSALCTSCNAMDTSTGPSGPKRPATCSVRCHAMPKLDSLCVVVPPHPCFLFRPLALASAPAPPVAVFLPLPHLGSPQNCVGPPPGLPICLRSYCRHGPGCCLHS